MELSNSKLPVQRFCPVYRTVKVAAEPDRMGAVIHCAYELDKKDGSLFSLQKDVELVCGFILSFLSYVHRKFCLPCWRTSQHYSLSLFSESITFRSSRCSAVRTPICQYKGRQGCWNIQCSKPFSYLATVKWRSPGTNRTPHHNSPLHDTSLALSNEDTPPGYMYISRFILVMLLCFLSVFAARLIELRAVYLTVPHGIWNHFFSYFSWNRPIQHIEKYINLKNLNINGLYNFIMQICSCAIYEVICRSGFTAPPIFNPGISCGWVLAHWPLYPRGSFLQCP